jgi:hypothetical protein
VGSLALFGLQAAAMLRPARHLEWFGLAVRAPPGAA